MRTNQRMLDAQHNQMDEFYTKYDTVEKELVHYSSFLKGKRVYCNCDDPGRSNFWKFLRANFDVMGLASLTATCFGDNAYGRICYRSGSEIVEKDIILSGDGDYRSDECLDLLDKNDVVITNPPFSLTKYFIPLMYERGKDFIILGNQNILTFKDVYPHVLDHSLYLGISVHSGDVEFEMPQSYELIGNASDDGDHKYARITGIRWFTSFNHEQYPEELELHSRQWNLRNNSSLIKVFGKKYKCEDYPVYDNYPAIEVPYTSAIPLDYDGVVGVPITFLDKYNPKQFKLVGFRKGLDGKDLRVGETMPYFRFLVQMRREEAICI